MVRVVSRRLSPGTGGRAEYVQGEIADRDVMRRAVDSASIVYHLATGGGPTWEDYERDFVQGAENLAAACMDAGIRRLIYASSIAALYLGARGTINETIGTDSKPQSRSFYGRAKIFAERALLELHRSRRLPVVILRPAIVVGPGGRLAHDGIGEWVSPTCCLGIGYGDNPLPFVLVEDVVSAFVLAKEVPGIEGRIFNLVGDVRPSAAEYVGLVRERSLRDFRFRPRSLARIQAFRLLLWVAKALVGRRDNAWPNFRELRTASNRSQIDCSAAKRLLGWRPVTDSKEFVQRAIHCHLRPLHPRDHRLRSE